MLLPNYRVFNTGYSGIFYKELEKKEKYFNFREKNKILEKTVILLAELREFNYKKSNYLLENSRLYSIF